ncbi:MAG: PEP-CTERM sorting domain-containing protein [Acidobacteriota bacterium]
MKKILCGLFLTVFGVGTASAAFTACPAPASPSLPYQIGMSGSITQGASVDNSFNCGGLNFSNFAIVNASGATVPTPFAGHIDLVTADSGGGVTTLGFNPNLTFINNTDSADLWFFFTVNGAGLDQIDLSVTGTGSSISEHVCAVAFVGTSCTQPLASLSNSGPTINLSSTFGPLSTIYIFKDISVGPAGNQPGHLTAFGQSFHASAVPEPATLSMMGLGLLGLGLIGRRRRKV